MLGPEMMEKESSILEISTAGFSSTSEILIVKIILNHQIILDI